MEALELSEGEYCMSIRLANEVKELRDEVKVMKEQIHALNKKTGVAVNPKNQGAAKKG